MLIAFLIQTTISISTGFEHVTCGSFVKLAHVPSGARLHSHEIPYGSGSGQQSVTGNSEINDPNSLFIVAAKHGETCVRGSKIECGSVLTLIHKNTNTKLHSHHFKSPITKNQEVSCSTAQDVNDNFIIGSQDWQ